MCLTWSGVFVSGNESAEGNAFRKTRRLYSHALLNKKVLINMYYLTFGWACYVNRS